MQKTYNSQHTCCASHQCCMLEHSSLSRKGKYSWPNMSLHLNALFFGPLLDLAERTKFSCIQKKDSVFLYEERQDISMQMQAITRQTVSRYRYVSGGFASSTGGIKTFPYSRVHDLRGSKKLCRSLDLATSTAWLKMYHQPAGAQSEKNGQAGKVEEHHPGSPIKTATSAGYLHLQHFHRFYHVWCVYGLIENHASAIMMATYCSFAVPSFSIPVGHSFKNALSGKHPSFSSTDGYIFDSNCHCSNNKVEHFYGLASNPWIAPLEQQDSSW